MRLADWRFMTKAEEEEYLTPPVVNETLPEFESYYGYPMEGAPLYDDAGNPADYFGGSAMTFTGSTYNGADGTLYLQVESETGSGYVRLTDWRFMTKAEEEEYLTPPVVNETLPAYESNYGYPAAGAQVFNANGEAVDSFIGSAMEFTGNAFNGSDGTLYLEVRSEGGWGYVRLADWRFMTKAEEEEYLTPPVVNETLPEFESNYGYPGAGAPLYDADGAPLDRFSGEAMRFTGHAFGVMYACRIGRS